MKIRTRVLLGLYLGIGLSIYALIRVLAGGLGIIGISGPAGEVLEFFIVVFAWPLVVVLTFMVVIQGR